MASSSAWISAVRPRKSPALGLQRFAFRLVLGLADGFREFVRLAIELFDLGLQGFPPAVEGDEAINVGLDAAAAAILLDEFGVFDDEFAIEHDRSFTLSAAICKVTIVRPVWSRQ